MLASTGTEQTMTKTDSNVQPIWTRFNCTCEDTGRRYEMGHHICVVCGRTHSRLKRPAWALKA